MHRKPLPPDSLGALAESARELFIVCRSCGHYARLDAQKMGFKNGWGMTMDQLLARCRCKHCNRKDARLSQKPGQLRH